MLVGSTVLSAVMMKYVLNYNDTFYDGHIEKEKFPFVAALLYGAIISATDPVAVVALLKELGAPKQLSTLIEGESLLNDGTAMVAFYILLNIVEGESPSFMGMLVKFCRLSGGGPLLGIITGIITTFFIHLIHNNFVLEINLTIVSCYIMFYIAEFTDLAVSGILALVALGLYMSYTGKTYISTSSSHALHHVWGYIGFCAETIIFILSGVIIGSRIFLEQLFQETSNITSYDFAKVFMAYIMLHFIRFVCIMCFWPCLKNMGYGLSFK